MTTFRYIPYRLELHSPAIVSTLSGGPNSSRSQLFVPGAAIRGAVAKAAAQSPDHGQLLNQLVLTGQVRYLHAYAEASDSRALPSSVAWRTEKGRMRQQRIEILDLAGYSANITDENEFDYDRGLSIGSGDVWPSVPLSRSGIPAFFVATGTQANTVTVRTGGRMHQQRDRNKGRAWLETGRTHEKPHGAIFTYEYIEAGQNFQGLIQIIADDSNAADELERQLRELLEGRIIHVGRSRRAGYGGQCRFTFRNTCQREATWADTIDSDIRANGLFRAFLLSSCIARHPQTGQIDPNALPMLLQNVLGGPEKVEVVRRRWDFEVVGSFNSKWRIETPQLLAVRAGGVFVLRAKADIHASRLQDVEHQGIGERRIDGFGRVVFLQHKENSRVMLTSTDAHVAERSQPGSEPSEKVQFLQKRLLDSHFDRWLERKVSDLVRNAKGIPSPSLLGRLRIPLRSTSPEDALQTLRTFLSDPDRSDEALKKEAQEKLEKCRISSAGQSMTLKQWLSEIIGELSVSNELKQNLPESMRLVDRDKLAALVDTQNDRFTVRLIDAVLETLARIKRTQEQENDDES